MDNHLEITSLIAYDITECPQDWSVTETCSQFHRLFFIYSGDAAFHCGNEIKQLDRDTLYLLPVFKKYKILHNPASPLRCLWFHITLNYTLLNSIEEFHINGDSSLFFILKAMEKLVQEKAGAYIVRSLAGPLMMLLNSSGRLVYVPDPRLNNILKFMQDNYNSKLTNTRLANMLNLDHRYFIRLFKKNFGQTPQEYLAGYRAYQCATLLLQGKLVWEVAEKAGFEDAKSFSRFFKAQMGISPSYYKKSYFLQP